MSYLTLSHTALISCPCCGENTHVTFTPAEPPIYYPNDVAHPGSPMEVDEWLDCSCADFLSNFNDAYARYEEETLERIMEAD